MSVQYTFFIQTQRRQLALLCFPSHMHVCSKQQNWNELFLIHSQITLWFWRVLKPLILHKHIKFFLFKILGPLFLDFWKFWFWYGLSLDPSRKRLPLSNHLFLFSLFYFSASSGTSTQDMSPLFHLTFQLNLERRILSSILWLGHLLPFLGVFSIHSCSINLDLLKFLQSLPRKHKAQ